MIELLAALSISAAVGLRVALPLLLVGLLYSDTLWSNVPLLSQFPQRVVLGVLVSWSVLELLLTKDRTGQRVLHLVYLVLAPVAGAIAGITVIRTMALEGWAVWPIAILCALLALVLQLVQIGWFYRLQGLPLWFTFLQDFLCVCLVLFAFDAPTQGGLIALLLLWLAIRSSKAWHRWYRAQAAPSKQLSNPRSGKQDPD
jgi:Domain of unknown function (DUF4126)